MMRDWIEQMNELGRGRKGFLFLISYDGKEVHVWEDGAIPDDIHYALPQHERMLAPQALPKQVEFQSFPPSYERYQTAFRMVQEEINSGNSYLLNLCFPSRIETNLSLAQIVSHAKAPYRFLWEGRMGCFSPEIFVQMGDGVIKTFPMKGTISRDKPHALQELLDSEKEACEHATVVDLLRNDLSRVASNVQVPRYRYVEELETARGGIYQSSSEVRGQLPPTWREELGSILAQLLPAGSVTGAPKKMTCEIIHAAEGWDRGYYTGVFGYFDGENLDSAVCIRYLREQDGQLYYHSGGGITSMSDCTEEYEELINKVYVPFTV